MDDIVERLRELLDGPVPMSVERQDVRDAADEIERLRAKVDCLADALGDSNPSHPAYQDWEALRG